MKKVNPDEFLAGQKACQDGERPTGNESLDWQRGYNIEYEREQIATELSLRSSKRRAR